MSPSPSDELPEPDDAVEAASDESFVRFEVHAQDRDAAERVIAEAWAGGAAGLQECGERDEIIVVHAPSSLGAALAAECAELPGVAHVTPVSEVADQVWSEAWKEGLDAVVVSPRLVVRPPFAPHELAAGQREIVIDPGQAFGTGAHESTRLVLAELDALLCAEVLDRPTRVLDVGTGSGVLALAALCLGADSALGFDLDPVATQAACEAAESNGLDDAARLAWYTGGIEAVAGRSFTLVLANLLRAEMLPIAGALAAATAPGGRLVLAGLLTSDASIVSEAFAASGLGIESQREARDQGGTAWASFTLAR